MQEGSNQDTMRQPGGAWPLLFVIACLLATGFGLYRLIVPGPFQWHIRQPSFIEGGIELLVLFLLCTIALMVLRGWRAWACVLLPVAIYLRLHGTDFAVLFAGLYCIGIYGLGWIFHSWPKARMGNEPAYPFRTHVMRAATGIGLLATALMLGGLVFHWNFEQNRIAGLLIASAGALYAINRWRTSGWRMPDSTLEPVSATAIALLITTASACIARSNLPFYYDSIWYGLRPDRVLFGPQGFYEFLGLTTQVHYYPKLYELLLSPLQLWGDASPVVAFGVFTALLLAMSVLSLARLFRLPPALALVITTLLICIPAVAGSIETPKGDILASAFVLFAAIALIRNFETRDPSLLVDVAVFSLLASTIRLAALPWLALIFLAWALALLRSVFDREKTPFSFSSTLPLMPAFAAFLLTHARTLLLTGTPIVTNGNLQSKLDQFGFQLKFPVGSLTGDGSEREGLAGAAEIIPNLALRPDLFEFHIFKWMGAAWLVFLAAALIRPDRSLKGSRGMTTAIIALLFPLLIAFNAWPARGGDGNYFIVSLVAIYVSGATAFRKIPLAACWLLLLCALGGLFAHLMSSNWVTGTRPFSFEPLRSPLDETSQVRDFVASGRLESLADDLVLCDRDTRVIGELPLPAAFALPVRFEPFQELSWNNGQIFASPAAFNRFIKAAGTDLVVLPDPQGNLPDGGRPHLLEFSRKALKLHAADDRTKIPVALDHVHLYPTSARGWSCITAIHQRSNAKAGDAMSTGLLSVPPLPSCQPGIIAIGWQYPSTQEGDMRIWVGEGAQRTLFAASNDSGEKTTGPWAAPGTLVTAEVEGRILDSIRIKSDKDCH